LQNASTYAKSILELATLTHSSIPFAHMSDSIPEYYSHFLNELKQALGGVKNTKRGEICLF
jgi:hypothetical protein